MVIGPWYSTVPHKSTTHSLRRAMATITMNLHTKNKGHALCYDDFNVSFSSLASTAFPSCSVWYFCYSLAFL
jgi:hypothetical protein